MRNDAKWAAWPCSNVVISLSRPKSHVKRSVWLWSRSARKRIRRKLSHVNFWKVRKISNPFRLSGTQTQEPCKKNSISQFSEVEVLGWLFLCVRCSIQIEKLFRKLSKPPTKTSTRFRCIFCSSALRHVHQAWIEHEWSTDPVMSTLMWLAQREGSRHPAFCVWFNQTCIPSNPLAEGLSNLILHQQRSKPITRDLVKLVTVKGRNHPQTLIQRHGKCIYSIYIYIYLRAFSKLSERPPLDFSLQTRHFERKWCDVSSLW